MKRIVKLIGFFILTCLIVTVSCVGFNAAAKETVEIKATNTSNGIVLFWNGNEETTYSVYKKTGDGKYTKLASIKGSKYTDQKVKEGKSYRYYIRKGKNVKSKSLAVKYLTSPKIVSVTKKADGLKIKWKKAEGAEKYIIYRRTSSKNKWKKLTTVSSDKLTYKDTTVKSDKKYSYYIKSLSGKSKSSYEGKYKSGTYIAAPENFALKQNKKKITLKWESVSGALKYEIYRKVADGSWKKLKGINSDKTKYTDTLKTTSKRVSYKMRTVTEKGKSAFTQALTIRYLDPKKPMVALTYDDGPHPTYTHDILDVLEKNGARATFFVVGERIASYSNCLERQNALGCEIANHSYSHVILSTSTDKTVKSQISKTDKLIKEYSGQTCKLVRAPGGSAGKALSLIDKPFIYWSVDTLDWQTRSSSKIISHIKKTVRDGSIILMHDLYESTADASEVIIPWLIKEGYQLVTVSEMMEAKGIKMKAGKVYYNAH